MNPAAPAPHDLIERLRRETDPFLLLLTGGRGAGKTRWCLKLLDEARAAGISAVGVLSPPVYTAGDKTAIDLLELASGQRQRAKEGSNRGLLHLIPDTVEKRVKEAVFQTNSGASGGHGKIRCGTL